MANDCGREYEKIRRFRTILLRFWETHGRKNLPWRRTKNPWKILIAEILLRKTTSQQALSIYEAISHMSAAAISQIPQEELETLLKPLGLYRIRSRQLRTIAERVMISGPKALHDPQFFQTLPGVGHYIRNSILTIVFGEHQPALDTNMIRIVMRVFDITPSRSRAREDRDLWAFAERLVPKKNSPEFNWAVLDLGAEVCRPVPKCSLCPLNKICSFYIGRSKETPTLDE
jgi:A/G-specific adenine glycosylase